VVFCGGDEFRSRRDVLRAEGDVLAGAGTIKDDR